MTGRSELSRFFTRLALGVGALVFSLIVWFIYWRVNLSHEVRQKLDKIHAAGLPTSGVELNAWRPAVPDAENGALVLTEAFALLRNFPGEQSNKVVRISLGRTNAWSPAEQKMAEEYVRMNLPALVKALEAMPFSRFRYPADFSYGPGTELPHLQKLRELAQLGQFRAVIRAESGDSNAWSDDVALQLKLAATLNDEPVLISHLVRNTIIRMASDSAQRCLNRGGIGDGQAEQLQAALAQLAQTNCLPLALIGERAMMIPIFRLSLREAQNEGGDDVGSGQPRQRIHYSGEGNAFSRQTGFFERDLNFFLGIMDQAIALAAKPPPESLQMTNQFESAYEIARNKYYLLSSMFLPSISHLTVRDAASLASLESAVAALAVERFRNDSGRLPDSLKDLVPRYLAAVPNDPFDGAPLRYRRLARGYVIYSIGADRHDDGGREPPLIRKSNDLSTYDITFVVER